MSTFVKQVGGHHYQSEHEGWQHWDVIERADIDYLTATGTKYITRWRTKGKPLEDLGKAVSYFHKAKVCRLQPGRVARRLMSEATFNRWVALNKFNPVDASIMKMVLVFGGRADYELAIQNIERLIQDRSK